MDTQQVLELVLTVLTSIALGLSVLLYGTTKVLRETNTDLRERNLQLEEIRVALEKRINNLETEVSILRNTIGAKEDIQKMIHRLDVHHEEARAHWMKEEDLLQKQVDIQEAKEG